MVRIGTAGWSVHREHRAEDAGSHLEQYARVFSAVEINSTFYRPHRETTWLKWAASVPDDFRFSVKAPKAITHEAQLRDVSSLLREFYEQLLPLGSKLGPVLFQLPPKLEFSASAAKEFFNSMRGVFACRVALEPRHASWFSDDVDALLRDFEVARVAADPPKGSPRAASPGGDTRWEYWRLHGAPRIYYSAYDEAFLAQLAGRLRAGDAWVIFDNTAASNAWLNALELLEMCR